MTIEQDLLDKTRTILAKAEDCFQLAKMQHNAADTQHEIAARQLDNVARQHANADKQREVAVRQHEVADLLDASAKKLDALGKALKESVASGASAKWPEIRTDRASRAGFDPANPD